MIQVVTGVLVFLSVISTGKAGPGRCNSRDWLSQTGVAAQVNAGRGPRHGNTLTSGHVG